MGSASADTSFMPRPLQAMPGQFALPDCHDWAVFAVEHPDPDPVHTVSEL